ncbi:hypothetical protein MKX01_003665 [Papaver californicum]|nr:hypothetical protein MKX01_003665 [Papaver californicum]
MGDSELDGPDALPPPPPVPPNVVPTKVEPVKATEPVKKVTKPKRVPMARTGLGNKGNKIQLLTNHFKVAVSNTDSYFFHYCVSLFYEDDRPVESKGVGRKVLDRVQETYASKLAGKDFAYDGEKSLFTVGPLPQTKLEFTVMLDEMSSNRNTRNGSPAGNGSPNDADRTIPF